MADFERLIPRARDDEDCVDRSRAANVRSAAVSRSSSFTRMSLARLSQRLRRRGWTVAADDGGGGGQDKENARAPPPPPVAGKHVKFDKRVYHGPVRDRCRSADGVRGILKNRTAVPGRGDAVPNRMRMYDVPVTSFYIGADEHLLLKPTASAKRCGPPSVAAGDESEPKKTRRFGTDIGNTSSRTRVLYALPYGVLTFRQNVYSHLPIGNIYFDHSCRRKSSRGKNANKFTYPR